MSKGFNVTEVPRVKSISKADFVEQFVKPQKPVVIENLASDWEAFRLWSFEYFKEIAGDVEVPLYDNRPLSSKYMYNEPHAKMKLKEYVDLIKSQPTQYRIFLFNLIKEVPELQNHFKVPDLGMKFLKDLPFLFFGAEDNKVFMHYDIDFANILHIHFEGKKRCLLFPPSETKYLYKVPNSLVTVNEIDFSNPDFEKFPALAKAKGQVAELNHGDTLYMPEGYWHHMHYLTPGFSMSLRALPRNATNIGKAVYNLAVMRNVENLMRKVRGDAWMRYKEKLAYENTNKNL
ncbi:MAG: cupin-like domain-containing protein [Bacteroidota bacterium]